MAWYDHSIDFKNPKRPGRYKRIEIDFDELKRLYHQGILKKDIASHFKCSIPTIKRHLKFIIPDNLRRYTYNYSNSNPINQRIIKLYTNHHYSTVKIAEIVGICDETIRRRLQRLCIKLRGINFKNLETFHPKQLNRRKDKKYPIEDLYSFNNKFLEYYCLMYSHKKIAELLQIDRSTVSRRIRYLRSQYYFKLRDCKRCENLFRFKVTERQKNSNFCSKCRLNYS